MNLNSCIYCGSQKDITRDHIPPKNLFSKPYPPDLITVPSCRVCNNNFSKDDEYFRIVIVIREDVAVHPIANKLLTKVTSSFTRKRAFSQTFMNQTKMVDRNSPAGLYLGKSPSYHVDLIRLSNVVSRIVRGLFYYENKRILPLSYIINAYSEFGLESAEPKVKDFIRSVYSDLMFLPCRIIGQNVLEYRYKTFPEDINVSMWSLLFYKSVLFFAFTLKK